MKVKKAPVAALLLALGALLAPAPQALAASPAPAWKLSLSSQPTDFAPGTTYATEKTQYALLATNVGGAETTGPIAFTDTLPEGVTPVGAGGSDSAGSSIPCGIAAQTVTCTDPATLHPGQHVFFTIRVDVETLPEGSTLVDQAEVSGGGAPSAQASTATPISSTPAPFGFLAGPAGLSASLDEEDGSPATAAASHPYQLTVDVGFPTSPAHSTSGVSYLAAEGGLRDVRTYLPRGLLVNPTATPVLCTEAQLESESCPDASVIGDIQLLTTPFGEGFGDAPSALYNMVPPSGAPGELAFNAVGVGIFVHLIASVRSDGDYALAAASNDVLARFPNPIFGARVEIWNDPSSHAHDYARGDHCLITPAADKCEVAPQGTAALTLPSNCTESPTVEAEADDWEHPGDFHPAAAQLTDLGDDPVSIDGCNALAFEPTISAQPTTNLTDSPSGLEFDLHQPQDTELEHASTAALKDATVTLPAGMSVNPSQADGLGACSEQQIGFEAEKEGVHFSKEPATCPDASKIGTLEVTSPLLAEYEEEGTKLATDPETGQAIPRPLHGSVYIAKPFNNPFDSLLAIYLAVEDPQSGIVAKLAGKVIPDPQTGQLTTRFEENPELPLEDVKLHLFGGARGSLITPPTCGTHTTASDLTPWSTPEGQDAHPEGSFQTTASPSGGNCPASEGSAPNKPAFSAGTLAPVASAYSPFVLKLSREDGSQRFAKIDATLPPGLTGKLAGIAQCSDAQIAQAQSRSHPNEGALEQANPSCPASSEVGTVDVAAGAGPTPFHVQGTAYLSGPYKGAPLSLAIVTPAIAGPFDLGAVVVRTALYLDPATAQIHAVSDPLPTILDGIPLDVRSIALTMGRPQFTLNPTSCDPMSIVGSETSALGQSAALTNPFQVGGCSSLPFKPKLALRLKGGTKRAAHPKLIATLSAKPGEANVASAQVKLPPSAFLDQAHIRTVCTRVQFAANQCPEGSIYGTAEASTPLLGYPLSGNVYLRSSDNKLPDLIVALKGPAYQPIEIDLDGKTDSVHGALRNTFEAVPDAPVSTFRLELFGGKRGLVINSRNLCKHAYRAEINLTGQSGKVFDTDPLVGSDCKAKGKRGHRGHPHPHKAR